MTSHQSNADDSSFFHEPMNEGSCLENYAFDDPLHSFDAPKDSCVRSCQDSQDNDRPTSICSLDQGFPEKCGLLEQEGHESESRQESEALPSEKPKQEEQKGGPVPIPAAIQENSKPRKKRGGKKVWKSLKSLSGSSNSLMSLGSSKDKDFFNSKSRVASHWDGYGMGHF